MPAPLVPVAVAALLVALAVPAAAAIPTERNSERARAAATKTVRVADNLYTPKRLTVAKGTRIEWVWSRRNSETHDVYLDKRPKGAGRFHSRPASRSATFARRLRRAGTYTILCTFHEKMSMRIDVHR
jgi:plastocyanin